jgi:hypothetical protein
MSLDFGMCDKQYYNLELKLLDTVVISQPRRVYSTTYFLYPLSHIVVE